MFGLFICKETVDVLPHMLQFFNKFLNTIEFEFKELIKERVFLSYLSRPAFHKLRNKTFRNPTQHLKLISTQPSHHL